MRRTPRREREHDHYGSEGKARSAFPEGSLFDQQPPILADNENQKTRAALPREFAMKPPAAPESSTSARAAIAKEPKFGTKARRILDHLTAAGEEGCTRQELSDELNLPIQSICSSVNALYTMGLAAANPGRQRLSSTSGLPQEIIVIAKYVERWKNTKAAQS